MTEAKRDHYQVLGVPRTATEQEIKSAFQKLVTEFHAAGNPKNIDDVEWLRTVTRGYRVLSDTALRMHYDRTGDHTPLLLHRPTAMTRRFWNNWSDASTTKQCYTEVCG